MTNYQSELNDVEAVAKLQSSVKKDKAYWDALPKAVQGMFLDPLAFPLGSRGKNYKVNFNEVGGVAMMRHLQKHGLTIVPIDQPNVRVAKPVDARDLKSLGDIRAGSRPAAHTNFTESSEEQFSWQGRLPVPLSDIADQVLWFVAQQQGEINDAIYRKELINKLPIQQWLFYNWYKEVRPICDERNNPPSLVQTDGLGLTLLLFKLGRINPDEIIIKIEGRVLEQTVVFKNRYVTVTFTIDDDMGYFTDMLRPLQMKAE